NINEQDGTTDCLVPGSLCAGGTSGGSAGGNLVARGFTRELTEKSLLPAAAGQTPPMWTYNRTMNTYLSNPPKVTVTDPFGNDTVYWFHASAPGAAVSTGEASEDGYSPEWNDS